MDVFTPEMASAVLGLHADSQTEARIVELRGKAHKGTLPPEDVEYKDFVEAVDLISIIQTKARPLSCKASHLGSLRERPWLCPAQRSVPRLVDNSIDG
jgi:hypothetical protein